MQHVQHLVDDDHLLSRAVVLVAVFGAVAVAAFVADADAVGIVTSGVATYLRDGAAVVERAVAPDVDVVTRPWAEAAPVVVALHLPDGVLLRWARVGAVEHQEVNGPR